jgi:hypothetical protein
VEIQVKTPNGFVSSMLFDVHAKIAAETRNEIPEPQAKVAFKTSKEQNDQQTKNEMQV